MKRCTKCQESKTYSEFYKSKRRKDGYNVWCKLCLSPLIKQHKQTSDYKQKQSEYSKRPEIKSRVNSGKRKRRQENPEKYRAESRAYYAELMIVSPEKRKAREAIGHAIRWQHFPKATEFTCKYCPSQAEEYHHPSYEESKWLEVEPVCKMCHASVHNKEVYHPSA